MPVQADSRFPIGEGGDQWVFSCAKGCPPLSLTQIGEHHTGKHFTHVAFPLLRFGTVLPPPNLFLITRYITRPESGNTALAFPVIELICCILPYSSSFLLPRLSLS